MSDKCKKCGQYIFGGKDNERELEEQEVAEIARQIQDGCTSGHLNDGEGRNVYYELKFNAWKD